MSRPPKCSTVWATAASTWSRALTSQAMPSAPSMPRSSPLREASATRAPASASWREVAAPIPLLAPVTSATLPAMSATWDSLSGSDLRRGYCDRVSALRLANAPVSFGAFELTAGGGFAAPDPEQVLTAIAGAGYEGTELGPPGFLGDAQTMTERLERHGLELVAGFVPVAFAD